MRDQRIVHDTSTPGSPKANGVVEGRVKEVVHGARTWLGQAGLPHCFGPYTMRDVFFVRVA